MKLYNLYEQTIFEEIIRKVQLTEAVSSDEIDNVIKGDPNVKGRFYYVSFDYADKDGTTSNRWVKIHQKNLSTANNELIDAKQISKNGQSTETVVDKDGNAKTQSVEGWRKFNLDKMSNFVVSKVPFQQPEPGFNATGNNSKTVAYTDPNDIVDFSYGYKDAKYGEKVKTAAQVKHDEFIKNREAEKLKRQEKRPIPAIPTTAPAPKPIVRTINQVPVAKPIVKTTTTGITNKPEIEPEEIGSEEEEEENLNVR